MKNLLVILVCFMIPIGILILLMRKKSSVWVSFIMGILAFMLSQIVLRLPLLNYLQGKLSVQFFALRQPVVWILLLAFSAGLFEELARYAGLRCIRKKHLSLYDALAFGLGHGGIEAMLLIGIPLLNASVGVADIWVSMMERCFAMLAHVMLSLIVWQGVKERKFRYVILAIMAHMGLDCYPLLGNHIWIIEGYLACYSMILSMLCYQFLIKKVKKYEKTT